MMGFTTAINSVFAFLIAGAIVFSRHGMTNELLLNLIFYIIITPVIGTTLTKLMFMSENNMLVADAIARMDEILNEAPLSESEAPKQPKDNSIELADVCYSYDGEKQALDHISLSVRSGEKIALVGPSGGGKSTLAALVSRFFDPQSGSVRIGGVDIRDISQAELMKEISFVFQNSHLIKGTIFENVQMARPEASREEVMEALRAAQCSDILEKMPQGADTVIGTKGVYLSGGEQQRIAIARAVLKNAPLLILDEATAYADPDNEVRVQQALNDLSKGKTVIMIAHRLSSITDAAGIYVLENGQIAEHGSWDELVSKNGIFAHLWNESKEAASWKLGKGAEA